MSTCTPTGRRTGSPPEIQRLTPGSVRWFRVIAITDENDGDDTSGGNQVDLSKTGDLDMLAPNGSQDAPIILPTRTTRLKKTQRQA